ncbi:MAG: 2-hydroxycyclohexanecarboxyl-CoA dehydrogenase [Solirubrobacteraceae bacterium]|jgi:2-hydroxycyclohexanecarboxyl-CoA dehydrogenase|nr:2-hydroxycyclohexanecarboxyl-CoA dehydrogenase [Solirubrobacteraceae bacterium]
MNRFEGRRALVTGGGRGIGAGIGKRLRAEGAFVYCVTRTAANVEDGAADEVLEVDLSDVEAAMEAVGSAGTLDVLVNNAGSDDDFGYFTQTSPERWRRLISLNIEGLFACTFAALPAMQEAKYGRIVNIGSEAGRIGSVGQAVYATTKAAGMGFTKSIARENARFGITCNYLASGPVQTPMLEKSRATPKIGDRIVAGMAEGTLLKRLGTPEEIAAAVAFVASEEAAFMTAEVFGVSGGMGVST